MMQFSALQDPRKHGGSLLVEISGPLEVDGGAVQRHVRVVETAPGPAALEQVLLAALASTRRGSDEPNPKQGRAHHVL